MVRVSGVAAIQQIDWNTFYLKNLFVRVDYERAH